MVCTLYNVPPLPSNVRQLITHNVILIILVTFLDDHHSHGALLYLPLLTIPSVAAPGAINNPNSPHQAHDR